MSRRGSTVRREPVKAEPEKVGTIRRTATGSPYFFALLLLFAGSGCAALIYEVVWFQLLQLVIGSSAISMGLLLAAYMSGLCLGSAALRRVIPSWRNPMQVYALLELGIGLFGLVALYAVPLVARIYIEGATSGTAGLLLRSIVAATCLLPPTMLMGASLPAISRAVENTPNPVRQLGLLYSFNIAGAVIGCLLAGFYLLRVYDMAVATWVAVAINLAIGLGALAMAHSGSDTRRVGETGDEPNRAPRRPGTALVYTAIALSGLTALGAEVVWTRLLSLLLGATVYTFSIILAVFLGGLWAGGTAGSFLSSRTQSPRAALAACQVLLALAIAWTAFTIARVLPYWPVDPWLSVSPWFNFDLDVTRCLRAIFPATLLWGASFPLAMASVGREGEDAARVSGEIYAANTAGAIVGALAFTLLLIPAIGTRGSQQTLVWIAALSALVTMTAAAIEYPAGMRHMARASAAAAATALLAWVLAAMVSDIPWQAIAYGRRVAPVLREVETSGQKPSEPLFVGEGMNTSVVITQVNDQRFFYVSGKSEASSAPLDMRLQRMMGHIPALLHTGPRSVLVVGFGAGVTAGSLTRYPEVESIVVCELEQIIPPASDRYFAKENYHVLSDPRTRIVYDDARHYILTAPGKFDLITTDPIHPWVKGTATLYSKQYYELVKKHLNPGGVAAQWLPIYESDEQTVKSELATFFSVFPDATVWSNYTDGDGYDLVLIGRQALAPSPVDIDALQKRLDQPAYAGVSASLADAGFHSAEELLGTYAGRAPDLQPMLEGASITDDMNLRLQYLAGLGSERAFLAANLQQYSGLEEVSEDLFAGAGARVDSLREKLGRPHRTF